MKYIVMDLEFNQPFGFEDGNNAVLVPECPFEIIQIGMAKLDENFNFEHSINIYSKPLLYKRMHPFVEKITGLTEKTFEMQKTFPEVYDIFSRFVEGDDNVFCVWGSSDVKLLFKNLLYYKLDTENISKRYINVQHLAGQYLKIPGGAAIGLKNAVEALEIEIQGSFHNALNDAVYTAKILQVVKNNNMNEQVFNVGLLETEDVKNNDSYIFNTTMLYKEAERLYGRKISRREKNIIKKIYAFGRVHKFDKNKK